MAHSVFPINDVWNGSTVSVQFYIELESSSSGSCRWAGIPPTPWWMQQLLCRGKASLTPVNISQPNFIINGKVHQVKDTVRLG